MMKSFFVRIESWELEAEVEVVGCLLHANDKGMSCGTDQIYELLVNHTVHSCE